MFWQNLPVNDFQVNLYGFPDAGNLIHGSSPNQLTVDQEAWIQRFTVQRFFAKLKAQSSRLKAGADFGFQL